MIYHFVNKDLAKLELFGQFEEIMRFFKQENIPDLANIQKVFDQMIIDQKALDYAMLTLVNN